MNPKVLIVGTVPYNKQTTARAFESYFNNWKKEDLAQIFSNPREPVHGHCGTFYQITDEMMLKRHLKKIDVGKIYFDKELADKWEAGAPEKKRSIISALYSLGSRKFPLNHLLRGWLWKKKFWCTERLNKWLDTFEPECVFLAFSDDFFVLEIALYVAQKYNIPIVSCIGDDYYFNDRYSLSPFYYLYRIKYKRLVNMVFRHGGSAAYISDKIRDKYNMEFGIDGETVYLTSDIKRHAFKPIRAENPLIVYCGNIRLGRNQSLCAVANALGRINSGYRLDVYSNESDATYYRSLENNPYIRFHGAVPYSQVMEIMDASDVLVVVEGFKSKDILATKYSLSTKVADSLSAGGSIITYGSLECGAISYMKDINCGPVCSKEDELYPAIKRLFADISYQRENYNRAIKVIEQNHNLKKSNAVFEKIVQRAVEKYPDNGYRIEKERK